jgi:hypothetical protein
LTRRKTVAYDPARAALALLCVLVVAFAASLFPATGFGAYPTSSGGGGSVDGSFDSPGVLDPGAVDSGQSQPDGNPTATPTPSPTPTETADESEQTPSSNPPANDGLGGDVVVGIVGLGLVALVGFVGFLVVPLGATGSGLSVAGVELPALQSRLRAVVGAIPRRTMTFVVGLSASVPGLLDSLGRTAAQVGSGLGVVASGVVHATANSARLLTAGVGALFVTLPSAFGGGLSSLFDGLSRAGGSFRRRSSTSEETDDAPGGGPVSPPADEDESSLPQTVEEAWTAMVELAPVRRTRSATPGEYARAAIDAGLPAAPVRRLTALFEEVRYGDRPSTADRVQSAREALRSVFERDESR